MARYVCCVAQHDSDSGNSSLNASREDLLAAMSSSGQSNTPPPFDSIYVHEACSSSSPPKSPQLPSSPKSTTSLPGYSVSLPVPDYHPNPTDSEQRLEFVPSRSIYGRSVGVWTKRIKDMTISLHSQDPIEIQRAPRYGNGGNIIGTIEFDEENLAHFEKVKLVIEGQTSIGNNAYEGRSELFVRKSFTLWRKAEASEQCPGAINFQVPFSAIGSRRVEQLPPSYVCELGQGGKISCSYSMHVIVSQKSRHGFWTNHNRHVIPINYVPWSRPQHTFPRDLVFPRAMIKALPEAWRQIMTVQGAMSCNLFIPSVSAFCVTDEIPFFLQLVAPVGYLDQNGGEEPALQVFLRRQVGVSVQEVFIWKDTTSSQGVVKFLPSGTIPPPDVHITTSDTVVPSSSSGESRFARGFMRHRSFRALRGEKVENKAMRTWEWEGTVRNNGIKVGGCSTDVLVINDFFVFCVKFRKPHGQVLEYHHAQPIEMVSEAV